MRIAAMLLTAKQRDLEEREQMKKGQEEVTER